jgi:hypothetical protein
MKQCSQCKRFGAGDYFIRKKTSLCYKCQPTATIKEARYEFMKLKQEVVKRKCLMCDRTFNSTGNRRCYECNNLTKDQARTEVSSYLR